MDMSARDASLYHLIMVSSCSTSEALVKETLRRIDDPKVLKLAIQFRAKRLSKELAAAGSPQARVDLIEKRYAEIMKACKKRWAEKQKKLKKEAEREKQRERFGDLADQCMHFVNKNERSKKLDSGSNPATRWLHMEYTDRNLYVRFFYQDYARMGGGGLLVVVKVNGKTVFDYRGPAMGYDNQVIKTYIPGSWEKKIPKTAD